MMKLQVSDHRYVQVGIGTNAALLLDWCDETIALASQVAKEVNQQGLFWICDADPEMLAEFVAGTNFASVIPPELVSSY